jgi:hypothetical protein
MNPIKRARTQDVAATTVTAAEPSDSVTAAAPSDAGAAAAPPEPVTPISGAMDFFRRAYATSELIVPDGFHAHRDVSGGAADDTDDADDAFDAAVADTLENLERDSCARSKVSSEPLCDAAPVPAPPSATPDPTEAAEDVAPPAGSGAADPREARAVSPVAAADPAAPPVSPVAAADPAALPEQFELVPGAPNGLAAEESDDASATDSDYGEQVCPSSPIGPKSAGAETQEGPAETQVEGPAAAFGAMLDGRKTKMLMRGQLDGAADLLGEGEQVSARQLMETVSESEEENDVRTDVSTLSIFNHNFYFEVKKKSLKIHFNLFFICF